MPEDFVIAANEDAGSTLPYLLRLPLGPRGVVLKARETWPRTAKVYCHRADGWPAGARVVERVPVRSCVRRGPAIDLVLDRGRENRSQFVFTRLRGGREAIFWQSARTVKHARPAVRLPTARPAGQHADLEILVDSRERYPYRFAHQAVSAVRWQLAVGDYAIELDGELVAAVERKSLADLAGSLTAGEMDYALAELAALPRAAVVVEEGYSRLFRLKHVRPSVVADAVARAQVRWPGVPIVFCEIRPLAQEWVFRFLGAARTELSAAAATAGLEETLPAAQDLPPPPASTAQVRAWAIAAGLAVSDRGRLREEVVAAYAVAHRTDAGVDAGVEVPLVGQRWPR